MDTGDNGLPWYCLYIKAKNDGNKSIKEVKWYLEYRTSGFKGNEESFSPHYLDYVQLEWSLDGNWQAGERKIFRKHIQCVEDKGSDGLKYAIHTMQNGRITPYWINYTGFGGSWGEKNFDKLIPSYSDPHNGGMIIINYGPHTRYAVQIPKFTVLGSSE
ncbi:MAG: hypothetical protein FWF37_02580 [Chloroflexi bacterium]|nr:hypothetical protein [Chloroflexota bacterium]